VRIEFEGITLRDYQISDVDDEVRWTNEQTEWFQAEAPGMTMKKVDADELRKDMQEIISSMDEKSIRWRFQIEVDGKHIGSVSSFFLDANYENKPWESIDPKKNAVDNQSVRELGIEICEMDCWGKGFGTKALLAFMNYYRSLGECRFVMKTRSGNERMLGCARKLGFYELKRSKEEEAEEGQDFDVVVLEKVF